MLGSADDRYPLPDDEVPDPVSDPDHRRGGGLTGEFGEARGVIEPDFVLFNIDEDFAVAGEAVVRDCVRLRGGVSGNG